MRLIAVRGERQFAAAAADWVAASLRARAEPALALPTGQTPIPLYAELVSRAGAGLLDLSAARVFNLDEYCGLPAADAHSYAAFLHAHLIDPLGLDPKHVRLLRGDAVDPEAECRSFDAAIVAAGGLDACILGVGANGHIAFNEPGSSWDLGTHVAFLSAATRAAAAARSEGGWTAPACGLTMGIKTILEARRVLLLIAGESKRPAVDALRRGALDAEWPVTSLIGHRDATAIELAAPA